MCSQAAPTHIIRFPSKLFETVNFGYGNLCIIAGERRPLRGNDSLQWLDIFDKDQSLSVESLRNSTPMSGSTLIQNAEVGWSPAMFDQGGEMHPNWRNLGDIAECRTGIYTGDNQRFIGYDAARITRRLNGHSIDWRKEVYCCRLTQAQRESGLAGEIHYVPLIRGGHREPFDRTAWAIDWSNEAVEHYGTDKKARLQNSAFYFRQGLSVPMVTTKRISAAMMSDAVFDQGVVGVFPRKPAEIPPLLLYLNSGLASEKMKRLVNGSANNSANYLKRLPVPPFSDTDIVHAAHLVDEAKRRGLFPQSVCDAFVSDVTNLATRSDNPPGHLPSGTCTMLEIDQIASR
jgi:hypothetical protein